MGAACMGEVVVRLAEEMWFGGASFWSVQTASSSPSAPNSQQT